MIKTSILKSLIFLCILAIYAIPEFGKELFVAKTGKFDHPGLLAVVLLSVGLLLNWKHIHLIINIICILMLGATSLLFVSFKPSIYEKQGLIIYPIVLILTLYLNSRLKKTEKKNSLPETSLSV